MNRSPIIKANEYSHPDIKLLELEKKTKKKNAYAV